jgi:glutamyl-tRNA synthetase
VVTRFPPEPSGYLHIGHAKAALMNNYFARKYQGKLIIRFDDTNPSKEKEEFEQSIQEDLALIGIHGDVVSHTSDHFDHIYDHALALIRAGKAYVDDTQLEQMRAERFDGIPSCHRDTGVEENLRKFEEMRQGTAFGVTCCLRAKIDMSDNNKAMRDPVIYRPNLLPHHRTGDKFKVYPTYGESCACGLPLSLSFSLPLSLPQPATDSGSAQPTLVHAI